MQLIRDIYATKRATKQPWCHSSFSRQDREGDRNLLEKHIPRCSRPSRTSAPSLTARRHHADKTLMIVDRIQQQHGLTALAHLTCVNHTREQVRELLGRIRTLGCRNILALRGDPPGAASFNRRPAI